MITTHKSSIVGIIIMVVSVLVLLGFGVRTCIRQVYFLETRIVEVEHGICGIEVVGEDSTGNLWAFRPSEDVQVGDEYILLMDNCANDYLYDDRIIVAVRRF